MPYIKQNDRERVHAQRLAKTAGELNYLLTQTCLAYLSEHGERYQTYNDMIGALECAKLEMYRRRIAVYENAKIAENGDVY